MIEFEFLFLDLIMKKHHFVITCLVCMYILCSFGGLCLPPCACKVPFGPYETEWGMWLEDTPECIGGCNNATQTGDRICQLFHQNGSRIGPTNCKRAVTACDSCEGAWSLWGNIGTCSSSCGNGLQRMIRTCYKRHGILRIRTCFGGSGEEEQEKFEPCFRMSNCTTTTPLSSSTTAATSDTFASSSSPAVTTTSTPGVVTATLVSSSTTTTTIITTTTTLRKTHESGNSPFTPIASANSGGINTIALAVVLGTASIISVTAVAITAAVVFLRKRTPDSHVVSYTSSSGEVVVAGVSLSRRNYTEDRTILPHALYELDFVQEEALLANGIDRNRPSSSRGPDLEGVYSVVDDRNKN